MALHSKQFFAHAAVDVGPVSLNPSSTLVQSIAFNPLKTPSRQVTEPSLHWDSGVKVKELKHEVHFVQSSISHSLQGKPHLMQIPSLREAPFWHSMHFPSF